MSSSKFAPSVAPKSTVRIRSRVFGIFSVLVLTGTAAHFAWRYYEPSVARHAQYQLTAESIHITPPPAWIRSDIKSEVLRDAGLVGTLSVLDDWDTQCQRIRDAFQLHPWIESAVRITKRLPSELDVELKYRRPIAAVESPEPNGVAFLPIDEHAVRLPDADLTDAERRYLPRISGVTGRPLVGDAWEDPRIVGGARLAAALGDVWNQLRLVEISSTPPQMRGNAQLCAFEIVTSGGTRIVWGATTGQETLAGESPFAEKRARLINFAMQQGKLESIDGPARIDVRSDLKITPRTARKKAATATK